MDSRESRVKNKEILQIGNLAVGAPWFCFCRSSGRMRPCSGTKDGFTGKSERKFKAVWESPTSLMTSCHLTLPKWSYVTVITVCYSSEFKSPFFLSVVFFFSSPTCVTFSCCCCCIGFAWSLLCRDWSVVEVHCHACQKDVSSWGAPDVGLMWADVAPFYFSLNCDYSSACHKCFGVYFAWSLSSYTLRNQVAGE